jgi:hypothetical protein
MSIARHHADWLSLTEVSGPFVSIPVLMRTFPQGLDPRDPAQAKQLRLSYETWQSNPTAPGAHRAWIRQVLTDILAYPGELLAEGQALPAGLEAVMAEYSETLRPDFALVGPAGSETAGKAQMLISVYSHDQALGKPVAGQHWKATPATRMMELLHAVNVPLGLVSNGEHWMLVFAPRGETTGFASWYATLWLEESITLRAFHSLLHVRRFFGVAANETLLALLQESAQDQQEVTTQLGDQVRDAVQVLILALDSLDHESGRTLLKGVTETKLYEAALTVMMRLVFLFSAEERGLLHLGKQSFDNNYAVSTLREQLQDTADRFGEEVLERRSDAWARLLATFRAVYGGVQHQDLLMPAYGGSLFDPDRFPFLEGRGSGTHWQADAAEPLAIDNRVVLHLLKSLQMLQIKMPGGGPAEARRLSFRALDIEQIGHVYEGLLDHTAARTHDVVLGLAGTKKKTTPNIALSELERLVEQGEAKLVEQVQELTGRSASALRKAISPQNSLDNHKVGLACGHDQVLTSRIAPFAGLLREDSFERPMIVMPGGIYVTEGSTRRSTGTHYTPRSLTEPIVQYTLEPLVYHGPAEGRPKEQWQLKSPKDILELKVCDMAMGSGAFLVQACRYLSERLVEAWENAEKAHPGEILVTPEGGFSAGELQERLIPQEAAERLAISRRLIADRCLFGVDINPMAVEMAKLSIWLITVDKSRPFTFLNHALKCGDSLLGIASTQELEWFYIDPKTRQQRLSQHDGMWQELVQLRAQLEALPSETPRDIEHKAALLEEVEARVWQVRILADVLTGARLYHRKPKIRDNYLNAAAGLDVGTLEMDARKFLIGRKPLHWALEFPEVFAGGGFHAFVGNPPFVGGKKITGNLGTDYREYLLEILANGCKGNADLCAYFFLRAGSLLRKNGMAGLIATNTIAQGDTREVGLDQLAAAGMSIPRAVPSTPWPGEAALEVADVWLYKGKWTGEFNLNHLSVTGITPFLTPPGRLQGKPYRLKANENKFFQGSIVLGMGFVLKPTEAEALITRNPKNKDCLFPYLNGEDLNSRPDQSPSRWVINFHDWPLNRMAVGQWTTADEKQQKGWLRSGIVPNDYPGPVASDYPDLLKIVEEKVKPERALVKRPVYRDMWWTFAEKQKALYSAISKMKRYLVHPMTSKHHNLVFYGHGQITSHMTVVLIIDSWSEYTILQSELHWKWSLEYGNKLETRPQYTPTDCFETFPFPKSHAPLESIGERYYQHRQSLMQIRQEGLTRTYNRFHVPKETTPDIAELRCLHVEMDNAVAAAYGWADLDLGHDFHETKQGIRYTISEAARREVLDRLLELNHQRYAEEVAAGLHDKKAKAGKTPARKSPNTAKTETVQHDMFAGETAE